VRLFETAFCEKLGLGSGLAPPHHNKKIYTQQHSGKGGIAISHIYGKLPSVI